VEYVFNSDGLLAAGGISRPAVGRAAALAIDMKDRSEPSR
jgi:hypothetical protein